jgi:SAM-dependent methyltransferase
MKRSNLIKRSLSILPYRTIKKYFRPPSSRSESSREKGADFYNRIFHKTEAYRVHYTRSYYYFVWAVIVDRIRRIKTRAILEVGCGAGQLAHAIYDANGIERYCGIDFSEARVEQARRNCPTYRFEVADVFQTDLFETYEYDLVIATEFLEHVERDLQVISAIRSGSYFIGTVPNFPAAAHVRYFKDSEEVGNRYSKFFTDFKVDAILANDKGRTFFLMQGIKTDP